MTSLSCANTMMVSTSARDSTQRSTIAGRPSAMTAAGSASRGRSARAGVVALAICVNPCRSGSAAARTDPAHGRTSEYR